MASAERDAVNLITKGLGHRLVVIVKAAPTWLAAIVTAAPIIATALADQLPTAWAADVTNVGVRVVAIAGAAIVVIRRLTPVAKADRGLTPKAWVPAVKVEPDAPVSGPTD